MKKTDSKFPFSMYYISGEGRLANSEIYEDRMEILEVISGEVNIRIGTEILKAVAGDFVYIPPTLISRVDTVSGSASIRGMSFDSSILEANMEHLDTEIFYMFYLQSKNKLAPFRAGHPVYDTLKRYMQESYDEYVSKDVCYKLPIRANIYLMMTALLRYYCGSKNESDNMIYHNVLRLRPVVDYITKHFCEKIYIKDLAGMLAVSEDYFTRMFKDSIGKTPIDYINALKINYAMRLLCETEDSMAQIAEKTGFCNSNYFHKIFKQYIDMSPLAYRKSTK